MTPSFVKKARFSNWPTLAEGKDRTAASRFPEKLSAMDRREFLEPGTRSKSLAAIFPQFSSFLPQIVAGKTNYTTFLLPPSPPILSSSLPSSSFPLWPPAPFRAAPKKGNRRRRGGGGEGESKLWASSSSSILLGGGGRKDGREGRSRVTFSLLIAKPR